MKVFLGGTCNNSKWRDKLIPLLKCDYFNPVVEDWTEECYQEELRQREECDYCLYVITPRMQGVYSIAEVIDDSNKRPEKTLFLFLPEDDFNKECLGCSGVIVDHELRFTPQATMSLHKVGIMVEINGGKCFKNMESLVEYLNDDYLNK